LFLQKVVHLEWVACTACADGQADARQQNIGDLRLEFRGVISLANLSYFGIHIAPFDEIIYKMILIFNRHTSVTQKITKICHKNNFN
jgi:hypothetical protein